MQKILLEILLLRIMLSCTKYQKDYYNSGNIKANYKTDKNGNWHGLYKKFYNNGRLEFKCNYSQGFPDGLARFYYPNGELKMIKPFKMGLLDGTVKGYDTNGIFNYSEKHLNGNILGYYYYDANGKMINGLEYLDPNDLPKLEDFNIQFSHRQDTFVVGDTTLIDIMHDSILKFQLILMFTNGSVKYDYRKDSFNFSFTPKRKGKSVMLINIQVNDTLRMNLGKKEYIVIDC